MNLRPDVHALMRARNQAEERKMTTIRLVDGVHSLTDLQLSEECQRWGVKADSLSSSQARDQLLRVKLADAQKQLPVVRRP